MDTEKKWTITNRYLNNFEKSVTVMNISNSNEISCKSREQLETMLIVGFYVIKNKTTFGIIKKDDSMHFMVDNNLYNIDLQKIQFKVRDIDATTRKFIAIIEKEEIINLTYERQVVFDNWSTEDDLDFFAWLTNLADSGRLNCILKNV